MWCLTFAGLLVTGTRAFAPAPRQWDGLSARRFVLATKVLPNMDLFPHKGIAPPLTVTIHEQTSGSPENFEATGLCLEANRDVLRVNRCHGLPTQLWSFLHSDNKGNNQLQLQGTSFCIHADARYGLHDVVAELQECAHESAELLALEEPIPLPTRKIVELSSTSWSMRYAMLSFVTLAVLGAYGLISLFRWLRKARPVVADRCNTPVTNDQGGVCSIVLLDVGQCATPFVASFDGSVESAVPAVMSMSTSPVEEMPNDHLHHPSALRNRGPISEALKSILGADCEGDVLEIASGSGCHMEHFSQAFPRLRWHPSEYVGDARELAQIDAIGCKALPNVAAAVVLDASLHWSQWPCEVQAKAGTFVLVYASNVTHISPWSVTCGLIAGAGQALQPGGNLIIYGPFKINGQCTTESNAAFDASLRSRNPSWGYRDVADLEAEAGRYGLVLQQRREMPANNFLLRFAKCIDQTTS